MIEIMKINGLQMKNYWLIQFLFNYALYILVITVYVFAGTYIYQFLFFKNTSSTLMLLILNGWGLSQISSAFLASVFLQKASTASIVGYGLAVYLMCVSQILNNVVYVIPSIIPIWYHLIPTFTFCRAMQHTTIQCLFYDCFRTMSEIENPEATFAIIMLYVQFVLYGFLAWYLNQIIP